MPVSSRCLARTRDVMCSLCDGDIGTQRRKGLCHYVCYQWYQSCDREMFCDEDFCTNEELPEGKPLSEWGLSPTQFCEKMGYKVFEAPACYNGEPLAKTLTLQSASL